MKIICTQENLKTGLMVVGRNVSTTNTLPILNNFLIKAENGLLSVSSTNLEIAITCNIRCKIETPGSVTVVSKTLTDLVNNLPNKNILLQTDQNNLLIDVENYHTKINTLPAEEFPIIPQIEGKTKIEVNSQELKTAIDQVAFAASNNQTQPEISGVLFTKNKEGFGLVATDRYRLAEKKINTTTNTETALEIILPQKTVSEISRIIGNQKGVVEMVFSETQAMINFNETQIISRLVDGQYPDYKQIIPSGFTTTAVVEKEPLINAIKTTAIFSQNNNSVRIKFSNEKQNLVLTTEFSGLGGGEVEIQAKITGKEVVLILNYHYLLDCFNSISSKNAVFKIIDDNSPSLIVPEDMNDYIYLVMPIKS